jgi:hypothetical protein
MSDIIKFPSKEERDARKGKTEHRTIDIDDFLAALDSLNLPAEISKEVTGLIPRINKLPSLQKLACKIYVQDLTGYGSAKTEAAIDFQNSNPRLAPKIASLSADAQRALYHVLASLTEESSIKDTLRSVGHTIRKTMGLT